MVIEEYTPVRNLPQRSPHALPPNYRGWKRRFSPTHNQGRGAVYIRIPNDHPLYVSNGWIHESRLIVFEAGLEFYPGDRICHKDRNPINNDISNLVVLKPGDPYPWRPVRYCACGCGQVSGRRKWADNSHFKINDEFTKLPVTRQRQLQLRWRSQGRCAQCGSSPLVNKNFCEDCRHKTRIISRQRYHKDPKYRAMVLRAGKLYKAKRAAFYKAYTRLYQNTRNSLGMLPIRLWPEDVRAAFRQKVEEFKAATQ